MSTTARQLATQIHHPKVKGSRRALLDEIAELIPDGQTMTAAIAIEELATRAGYSEQAMRKARDVLVEIGVLRIVGGGRGRLASYELVQLPGSGEPSLPLLGRARPRAPRAPAVGPNLFDQSAMPTADGSRATDIGTKYRRCVTNIGTLYRRWLANIGTKYRTVLKRVGTLYRRSRMDVDVDDARARGSTDLRSTEREVLVPDRAARVFDFLDWFEATYAAHHQGARCTVDRARDGERIAELLAGGRTIERLKAMTIAMWNLTTDGIPKSERWYIAEVVQVRNIWLLHKKANMLDLKVSRAHVAADAVDDDDIWCRTLARIEAETTRYEFHQWFRDTALIADRGAVIEVAKPGAGSDLFAAWIPKHYGELVRAAIEAERSGTRVEFVVVDAARREKSG